MENNKKIQQLEAEIFDRMLKLESLRSENKGLEVKNYIFRDLMGEVTLSDLFLQSDRLLVIHNMGHGCRYCTLWADGINGILHHLETAMSVVLVSGDSPEVQKNFANSRSWRFRMASHGLGDYIKEQSCDGKGGNEPGAVAYEKRDGKIFRKNASQFGEGDVFCSMWPLLSMAGISSEDWTPQYRYWQPANKLLDGGQNRNEKGQE